MEAHRGKVNLERMLERKPLHAAEQQAAPATVCVTGGAGYIGSRIVARLLAAGHTVHATWRAAGDDAAAQAALQELPGAAERLHWFPADLMQAGSFDAAVAGCKYVIHTAGVVSMNASKKVAYAAVIEPTLRGIENVLGAVNRTESVEKVILTSSMAAVSADFSDRGPGHLYSEADWNVSFPKTDEPYFTAKALAEWQAWAIAGQQERWRLITICPGNTYGPLLAASPNCGPVPSMKKLMDGSFYPFIAPLGLTTVDLDDVAAAHALAMVLPQAKGRYLLCERSTLMTQMAALLRERYPAYWVPTTQVPFWAAVPILVLTGTMSYRWVRNLWNKRAAIDCSKAQRELGLSFIPLERTLPDFMDRLLELGILQRIPAYSAAPGALPLPHAAVPASAAAEAARGAAGVAKANIGAMLEEAEAAGEAVGARIQATAV